MKAKYNSWVKDTASCDNPPITELRPSYQKASGARPLVDGSNQRAQRDSVRGRRHGADHRRSLEPKTRLAAPEQHGSYRQDMGRARCTVGRGLVTSRSCRPLEMTCHSVVFQTKQKKTPSNLHRNQLNSTYDWLISEINNVTLF